MSIEIKVDGARPLANKYSKAARETDAAIDRGVMAWGQATRQYMKSYPYPGKRPYKMRFFSEKQRKYIMWRVRNGGLGYSRTGGIANSYSVIRRGQAQIAIRNSRGYADFVVGRQAYMHAGNWYRARPVIMARAQELNRAIDREFSLILPR